LTFRFLLDEDLPPKAAEVARGLGLDVVSVHEVSRAGRAISDPEQLRYAAAEGRVLVTRNRDDFIRHTVEFYRKGEPLAGVLIVTGGLPNDRPERISPALLRWKERRREHPESFGPYSLEFLGSGRD
jgi:predicted nuclease of predicted toxin-antitoxin system